MSPQEENKYIKENKIKFISFKLDTGRSMMEAKANKGNEGCLLNLLPVLALKCMRRHIDDIIKFKEKESK